MEDHAQEMEMTKEEIRDFIEKNLTDGRMVLVCFNGIERKDAYGE